MIVAPRVASLVRFSRCMTLSGDSRGMTTSGLRSLIVTSAARRIRLSASPCDTAATVAMLHGASAMPFVGNVPLAIGAAISDAA